MLYHLSDDLSSNLILFTAARDTIAKELDEIEEEWEHDDRIVVHPNERVRHLYKAHRDARHGIDKTIESIEKETPDID